MPKRNQQSVRDRAYKIETSLIQTPKTGYNICISVLYILIYETHSVFNGHLK